MTYPKTNHQYAAGLKVTPESVFESRRKFIKAGVMFASASAVFGHLFEPFAKPFRTMKSDKYKASENLTITDEKYAKSYTNFYEFGMGKSKDEDVFKPFKTSPWEIKCDGLVENPLTVDVEDLQSLFDIEERVYRMRCVETWSAVIPWNGYPLGKLLEKLKPKKEAKYVKFYTFLNPKKAVGQRSLSYPWPYTEGLRLDEAMNDLTLLTFGMYGKPLSKANGSPVRLVVPWKYGFKSIKSIKRIELVAEQPKTLWNQLAPGEYGFYANVNPEVDHPRWSQRKERPIGSSLTSLFSKKETLMFNGYADEVAGLYKGMDLRKFF